MAFIGTNISVLTMTWEIAHEMTCACALNLLILVNDNDIVYNFVNESAKQSVADLE